MIQINKIKPFKCRAYDPNGKYIGMLNDFEFNDLRAQIKEQKVSGYYLRFNGEIIEINDEGNTRYRPDGFYDLFSKQLRRLVGF